MTINTHVIYIPFKRMMVTYKKFEIKSKLLAMLQNKPHINKLKHAINNIQFGDSLYKIENYKLKMARFYIIPFSFLNCIFINSLEHCILINVQM